MHDGQRKSTLSPPLSRKREREQIEFAAPSLHHKMKSNR
jgi:hypothetical protein